MADHQDRHTCGKCTYMLWRLGSKGERLPIPKNNPPKTAVKADAGPAKKAPAKKKK